MMNKIIMLLAGNSFFRILLIAVALDTILGGASGNQGAQV